MATETIEEQSEILSEVFMMMPKNRISIKLEKFFFMFTEIAFLVYIVFWEEVRASKKGLEAIEEFPEPQTVLRIQRFLGMCQYFRKYSKGFALRAKPLYDSLKKDAVFIFAELENNAFIAWKKAGFEASISYL